MSNPIVTVLKNAAKQMEEAGAKAGRAFTSCFRDASTGLRNTARSHDENDTHHAGVFERTHRTAEPNVRPRGNSEAPPTPAHAGPSVSKGWEGKNGLSLTPEENAKVEAFHARSAANEPRVTSDIDKLVKDEGGEALGRDFRLKTQESLKTKIAGEIRKGATVDEAIDKINDSVRYTMSFPKEKYAAGSQHAISELESKGYTPIDGKFKNTWDKPGYQGINSNWTSPDGQRMEVQFHTPESFHAKDAGTHHLYEEQRTIDTSQPGGQEKYDELQKQQDDIFAAVPRPPGATGVRPASTSRS